LVVNNTVTFVDTGYHLEGELCFDDGVVPHVARPPVPIVDRRVVVEAPTDAINAATLSFRLMAWFDTEWTASGQLEFTYTQSLPLRPCLLVESATWTAAREPLPPGFPLLALDTENTLAPQR
jgi:hypothetical protein